MIRRVCLVELSSSHGGEIFYVNCLASTVESNDDCESNCDLGRGYGYNEKDQHLAVVVGQSILSGIETGKRYQSEIRGAQHELEAHEDHDNVTANEYSGQPDGEEESRDEKVFLKRGHWLAFRSSGFGLFPLQRERNDSNGCHEQKDPCDLQRKVVSRRSDGGVITLMTKEREADKVYIWQRFFLQAVVYFRLVVRVALLVVKAFGSLLQRERFRIPTTNFGQHC